MGTLPQALFFPRKKGPIFLEALLSRTARIHQIWARIMRAWHGNIWQGTDHEGTAQIHQIWARHAPVIPAFDQLGANVHALSALNLDAY